MIFRQTGLFDEQQGNIFLKKHSALAQINNVTSLVQRKSINAILRIAKDQLKRDPSQTSFQIDMGVLKNLAGITNNDNIGLKNGLKSLVSLVIEYNILKKDTYEWGAFPFLSFVKIEGAKRGKIAKVVFSLSPPILESLAKPSMYVKLNLFLQRGFKSKYSLALFEVLSDYMKIGKLKLEIDTLRTLLGIEPHKYSVFAMFRKKVLDIAMREINKLTEMEVSYKAEKIGRKYGIITFLIEGKIEETNMEEARTKIIEKLNFYGFKEKQTNFLLKKHDEDYLLANIGIIEEMLENGKKIKDVKAYLSKAFLTDFRKEETEFDKVKKEKQTVLAEEKVAIEKQELAKNALKWKYKKERQTKLASLKSQLTEAEINNLKSEFEQQILATEFQSKIYKAKGFNFGAIQSQWNKFLSEKFLAYEFHNFENYSNKDAQAQNVAT